VCRLFSHRFVFLVVLSLVLSVCDACLAEDVSFSPRFDSIASDDGGINKGGAKSGTGSQHIYSFSRFSPLIQAVCKGLATDQRNALLSEVASESSRKEAACATCRALLNEFASGCRRSKQRNTMPTERLVTVPYPARNPSTVTLDGVSRLGQAMFELDRESGHVFVAISRFASIVLSQRGLSRGELDYFGTFFAFFKSPWVGRVSTERYSRLAQDEESRALFEQ
jgi:hypothetical protein